MGSHMAKKNKNWLEQCQKCKGKCCRHIALEIDKPTCKTDYDNIRWYLLHKNVTVFIDHDNKWNLQFPTDCEYLTGDNRCKFYNDRPRVCSDYPGENHCEFEGNDEVYKVLFKTEPDFLAYLKKKKIDWKWKKR